MDGSKTDKMKEIHIVQIKGYGFDSDNIENMKGQHENIS